MKRTYPANIDGQIFYIDEDAYLMLQDYLQQLKLTFKGTEGAEIVGDIESRIRELFEERVAAGASVIVKADVTSVIETMGRPEQLNADVEIDEEASDAPGGEKRRARDEEQRPFIELNIPTNKRLYRNMKNKVFILRCARRRCRVSGMECQYTAPALCCDSPVLQFLGTDVHTYGGALSGSLDDYTAGTDTQADT